MNEAVIRKALEEENAELKERLEIETIYSEYWKAQALKSHVTIQKFKEENGKLRNVSKGCVAE